MRLTENYKLGKTHFSFEILREPNSSEQSYLMDYFCSEVTTSRAIPR